MRPRAKGLRKNLTDAERWLWQHLRNRELAGWKFRRQHPVGPFIVDFICIERKLIIEVDGGQQAESSEQDTKRSEYLKERGYRILRFWDNEVLREGKSVSDVILSCLAENTPSP
jgi:very-short-patch-repair endonuclease